MFTKNEFAKKIKTLEEIYKNMLLCFETPETHPSICVTQILYALLDEYLELLAAAMCDVYHLTDLYLYDYSGEGTRDKEVIVPGKPEVSLNTPEDLYDAIWSLNFESVLDDAEEEK